MPPGFDRRVSRRFSTTAGAGSSGDLTAEVKADATVEKVEVRFYSGPQLDLELLPFVEPENGERFNLVNIHGRTTLVGDADRATFFVAEEVSRGDLVGVEYTNNDGSHAYDFHVDVELERAGGAARFGGFFDRLRGWL